MTTETQNQNDTPPAVETTGEDTALATAAKADTAPEAATDDAPVESAKDEAPAAPEGAPEKYDPATFVMPEGVEFDAEGFEAVEPVLRDLNLTQDQAGKLMGAYAEKIVPLIEQRALKAQDDAAAELRANLARDLQADPEVGGKKLDESRSLAAKAITHFIPDASQRSEFSTFLNESGLGNHPMLMRLVSGAGALLSEASTPAGEAHTELSAEERWYGKKKG